jgi:hypothetical protein
MRGYYMISNGMRSNGMIFSRLISSRAIAARIEARSSTFVAEPPKFARTAFE